MGDEPIPATGRSWRASIHGIISPSVGHSEKSLPPPFLLLPLSLFRPLLLPGRTTYLARSERERESERGGRRGSRLSSLRLLLPFFLYFPPMLHPRSHPLLFISSASPLHLIIITIIITIVITIIITVIVIILSDRLFKQHLPLVHRFSLVHCIASRCSCLACAVPQRLDWTTTRWGRLSCQHQ
ncbi:hypothetical protein EV126DRAFT_250058 [Verticillium dahliae]|nr:hypothetical protein EV126DRAFT_250058 [Verticillium dahliae]